MIDPKLKIMGGWPNAGPFITADFKSGVTVDSTTGVRLLAGIRQPKGQFESVQPSQALWCGVANG